MSSIRAFIAIDLPPHAQEAIQKQTSRLRQTLGDGLVRWIPAHNLHLTLKFLGDIAASHADFIKHSLLQIADSHPGFDLQIGGIGSYPNSKLPRVLWVGLHASAALPSLQRGVESAMVKLGYEKEERAFSPHLTIGRVKQNVNPAELQKVRVALEASQPGNIAIARVDSVHLYKSDLQPAGSIYTKLYSAMLQPAVEATGAPPKAS
jgi:2'-5' RNA ligase